MLRYSSLVALVGLALNSAAAFSTHRGSGWVHQHQHQHQRHYRPASALAAAPVSSFVAPLAGPKTMAVAGARVATTIRRSRSGLSMSLFGLGAPELAVIVAVAGFVLGPQKLAEMARDFGKVAGELKDVPKEFQEGLAEGDQLAKDQQMLTASKTAEPEAAAPPAPAAEPAAEPAAAADDDTEKA